MFDGKKCDGINGSIRVIVHSVAMDKSLSDTGPERRRNSRLQSAGQDLYWKIADNSSRALVVDLSRLGFCIKTGLTIGKGQVLRLKVEAVGMRRARVIWQRGSTYGCVFDVPLAPEDLGALLGESTKLVVGEPSGSVGKHLNASG